MNLDVLKTFCDLIDTGSFSKAAQINFVSQSAVSQQLAKLEREMQTQLVNRGSGLVSPTEAGRALYDGSREILRRWEILQSEVRAAADAIRGVLRIGTVYSVGLYQLTPYIRRFLGEHSEVNVRMEYARANQIYAAVASGEMDLGVVAYPEPQRSIEVIPFATDQLVVVMQPGHEFAGREDLEPTELEGQAFIAFSAEIPTRRSIDKLLRASHVHVNIRMEFDNVETLKRAVEIGLGVSILPAKTVETEVRHGELVTVPIRKGGAKWIRPLGILRRRGKAPSPAEGMFLAMFKRPRGAAGG